MTNLIAALALTAATVVPDARYGAGPVYRFFFGSQWRETWTLPIEAPVLESGDHGRLVAVHGHFHAVGLVGIVAPVVLVLDVGGRDTRLVTLVDPGA